jgi:hypothetical protein
LKRQQGILRTVGFGAAMVMWGAGSYAASVTKPFTFTSGSTISSSEMNSNFDTLFTEINAKETRLGVIEASSWVTSDKILDGTITAADIADGTVTTTDIADETVTTTDIADGTIASADIADGTVTTTDIADGTIASADIADGTVTTSDIADGTVATADVADGAITAAKLATGVALKVETSSRTVSLSSSMTRAAMQSAIDAVGRYLETDVTITFQFADGTYTYDTAISFSGFTGKGAVQIYGNTAESNATSLHTTQSVIFDYSGQNADIIKIEKNTVPVVLRNIKFSLDSTGGNHGLISIGNTWLEVFYNYFLGNSTTNSRGVFAEKGSNVHAYRNYFSNTTSALQAGFGGTIHSESNTGTGTNPQYGLRAIGGTIVKFDGTQPAGSSSNEDSSYGGVVR